MDYAGVDAHTVEELLERHRAFWQRTPVDRPLLTVRPWQEYGFYKPFPAADGAPIPDRTPLEPGLVDIRRYAGGVCPTTLLDGDFLQPWVVYDACWMEAMLGCRVLTATGTTWAEHFVTDWAQVASLTSRRAGPWLNELLRTQIVLADLAGPERPIGQPLMRGPADMALAALGSEMFGAGFYEHPGPLTDLLMTCTQIRLEAAYRRLQMTPRFHGGYCARDAWGVWSPGPLIDYQEDAAGLLSPKTYRQHIAPLDRELARRFEYSLLHIHSGQMQMLPAMLEIPELTAIQIAIDPQPYSPPAATLMGQFEAVQEAGKSLLVIGPMTQAELELALARLSPTGLALRIGLIPE